MYNISHQHYQASYPSATSCMAGRRYSIFSLDLMVHGLHCMHQSDPQPNTRRAHQGSDGLLMVWNNTRLAWLTDVYNGGITALDTNNTKKGVALHFTGVSVYITMIPRSSRLAFGAFYFIITSSFTPRLLLRGGVGYLGSRSRGKRDHFNGSVYLYGTMSMPDNGSWRRRQGRGWMHRGVEKSLKKHSSH